MRQTQGHTARCLGPWKRCPKKPRSKFTGFLPFPNPELIGVFRCLECSRTGVYDKLLGAVAAAPTPDPTGQGDQALVFTTGMYLGQLDIFQC